MTDEATVEATDIVSVAEDPTDGEVSEGMDYGTPVVYGGDGHNSVDARWLLVIEKLPPREEQTAQERIMLLDADIREAMVRAARRLDDAAAKYRVTGFDWDLNDIAYDMGAPRTVTATLRIARNGA